MYAAYTLVLRHWPRDDGYKPAKGNDTSTELLNQTNSTLPTENTDVNRARRRGHQPTKLKKTQPTTTTSAPVAVKVEASTKDDAEPCAKDGDAAPMVPSPAARADESAAQEPAAISTDIVVDKGFLKLAKELGFEADAAGAAFKEEKGDTEKAMERLLATEQVAKQAI